MNDVAKGIIMDKHRYNVFLNYRRATGRDFARILQQAFEARGLSVFFDYDSLQDGAFSAAIFEAIENCDVFVIAYSEFFFDGCRNEDDWVRIEIEHAVAHGKKIVPVAQTELFNRLPFPDDLPASLAVLSGIQISEIHPGALFGHSVDDCIAKRFPAVESNDSVRADQPEPENAADRADFLFERLLAGASQASQRRAGAEVDGNGPCPCGSGKKYKHCHGKIPISK